MRYWSMAMALAGCLALRGGTVTVDSWTVTTPDAPDATLPNVLCVGDSILGGYGAQLRPLLAGKANVYTWNMAFFATAGARGIPVSSVNAVGALADFSSVVFNNGLHSYNWDEGAVSDADVAASYATLADALAAANPRAKLYYLATTPHTGDKNAGGVVTGYGAYNEVMKRLNRHARAVMLGKRIPYLDAYALLSPRLGLAAGDHFHWQKDGYVLLARLVATALGHAEPADLQTAEVNSAVSVFDGCAYTHQPPKSGSGYFNNVELHCGLSSGDAFYSGFAIPALPGGYYTKATLLLPVANSAPSAANLDLWGIGWTAAPGNIPTSFNIQSDTDTAVRMNGRAPLKIRDNLVPANTAASGTLACDATVFAGLCVDRAATTNAYAVFRVNPDAAPTKATQFRDVDKHPSNPSRLVYTVPAEPVAEPLPEIAATQSGAGYHAAPAAWTQYATASDTAAAYPAALGRVDGVDRSLVLRVPLEVTQTLTDAALNLVVAPVDKAQMRIPAGVDIDVWALGVQDVAADTDPAAFSASPFLAGTSDVREILGVAPVKLGTVAVGGTVLVPGQTLGGDAAFKSALKDWANGVVAAGEPAAGSTRYLVLRVNASAPTPAAAGDWSFAVGTRASAGLVSMFETVSRLEASTLPEAVDRVITLRANTTYTFTDETDFGDVTNIVTQTGTEVVFDVAGDAVKTLASAVTGIGTVHKTGAGELALASTWRQGYRVDDLRVEEGVLRLPQIGAGVEFELKNVFVAEGATLCLAGSDTGANTRTIFGNLSGAGLVTNAWSQAQVVQQAQNTTSPAFAGTIGGKISNFWVYPNARINLLGTNSTAAATGGLPGFGSLGVAKFGLDANENSSAGRAAWFELGPNSGGSTSALVYLGSTGETTEKGLYFRPWTGAGGTCMLDAGEGGLVWNGKWTIGKSAMVPVVLQGDGFATNVMAGLILDESIADGSAHIEKRGAGTWFLKPPTSTHRGVTSVKEGKLMFETLREKGVGCSLGLSTRTYAFGWRGLTVDESKAVPYAFALGGGAKGEATLECVGRAGDAESNSAAERPLALAGDGRLATTCAQPFSLKGVSSIAAAPVTLTLDGTNGASALDTVEDGASALSVAKDGPGTWTLLGPLGFTGSLAVNAGTLEIRGLDASYTWYRYVMKTLNSYYSKDIDSCRVTREFALYDADGIRRNVGLAVSQAAATELQPGEATVVEANVRSYQGGSWAFTNPSFYLQNMFDDNGGTASYLAGRNNGTTADTWISVAMRLPEGTPPIVACDVYGEAGTWDAGRRRTVAYSVMGSYDGVTWIELTNQTTNETSRFTSGWYSDGTPFASGAVRKLSEGHGIALPNRYPAPEGATQLARVSSVSVAAGATLRARGTVTLRTLDVTGPTGGTIDGFTVAASGTVRLPAEVASGTELPYTFVNMKGQENFRNWTVYENGAVSKRRLAVRTNRLAVCSDGMALVLR